MTDEELIRMFRSDPTWMGKEIADRIEELVKEKLYALERMKAEAKAEGMRMAARITRVEAEYLPISLHDAALRCEAAILAAIDTLRVNGGENDRRS